MPRLAQPGSPLPCYPACSSQASSTAGGFSQQSTAVADAVSTAVSNICGGGDAQAQATAAAQATAKVSVRDGSN